MKPFAKRLHSLIRPNESKREFAQRLGVSPVQLSRYFSGVTPGRKVLERIAGSTGASVDWLLYGGRDDGRDDGRDQPKRLGAKTTRTLNDRDLLDVAFTYIDDIKCMDKGEKETIKKCLDNYVHDRAYRDRLGTFVRFLNFECGKNRGKA